MKSKLNLICSILAIFCFISMYMPVIAPRFPAGQYYAEEGSFESNYFFTGDYYMAKNYWSLTDYAFAVENRIARVVISLDQALLLLWALMSVKGEAGKKGIIAALINLVVEGAFFGIMLSGMWACRWGVLVVSALIMIMTVAMAYTAGTAEPAPNPEGQEDKGKA